MMAQWPTNSFMSSVADRYAADHKVMAMLRMGADREDDAPRPLAGYYDSIISNNIAKVQVYYRTTAVQHLEQHPFVTWHGL
ncbi:PREDICTED: uncharacterized protein LOC106815542 isoform X2 [Priapulus caudatus]|nr:PREDICTED: uncharacterized protein LOC106815542 isoform X2 [Priapulus caudatus]